MHLSFVRIDGSGLGHDARATSALQQVVAVEARSGRSPVRAARLEEFVGQHVLTWECADGQQESIDVTGDASLLAAFSGGGLMFAEFTEADGIQKAGVQVLSARLAPQSPQRRERGG